MTNWTIITATILFAGLSGFMIFKEVMPSQSELTAYPDLPVVNLDLHKMMGRWYVVAKKPNLIEKFCRCTRTTDTLVEPLKIQLSESCLIWGRNITSNSWAVPEAEDSGKWTNIMDIVGPWKAKADYWIIERDDDYRWIVIGQPGRSLYWIMSRDLSIDDNLYYDLLNRAAAKGFDIHDIERDDNTGCEL